MAPKGKTKSRHAEFEDESLEEVQRENRGGRHKPANGKGPARAERDGHGRKESKGVQSVVVDNSITVRDLAKLMERSPIDLIKVLM